MRRRRRPGRETTTLELTALRRPFIYFPLEGHFEQNLVVAKRLARHRAGQRLLYSQTTPERLAEAVFWQLGREANWPPIPPDGARRAARLINELPYPPTSRKESSLLPGGRHEVWSGLAYCTFPLLIRLVPAVPVGFASKPGLSRP